MKTFTLAQNTLMAPVFLLLFVIYTIWSILIGDTHKEYKNGIHTIVKTLFKDD